MFTEEEQQAILQCFWQLLSACPSESDSELIENIISNGWKCKDRYKKLSLRELIAMKQCNVDNPMLWMFCAIQMSPFQAFLLVSKMSNEKKEVFKKWVIQIVFNGGDEDYKSRMCISLFDKTNISYRIVPKVVPQIGVIHVLE